MTDEKICNAIEDSESSIFRLYDSGGKHILSLVPCSYTFDDSGVKTMIYDLASPSGEVIMCEVPSSVFDYLTVGAK